MKMNPSIASIGAWYLFISLAVPASARKAHAWEVEARDVAQLQQMEVAGAFDFVEIGTSDYETLIETASNTSRGLSVEPLQLYIDRLPNRPHVSKVTAAIVDDSGGDKDIAVYWVDPEDIDKHHMFPQARGCNSVGAPHAIHRDLMASGQGDLVMTARVPLLSIQELFSRYGVRSVDYLKVDTEGYDTRILSGLMRHCDAQQRPSCWPRTIHFESNWITPKADRVRTVAELKSRGYLLLFEDADNVGMVLRPMGA